MSNPDTRHAQKRFPLRNTYSQTEWMADAIVAAALDSGQTQSDVIRECIEHGLAELYGITKHGTLPGPQRPPEAPNRPPATDYTDDGRSRR